MSLACADVSPVLRRRTCLVRGTPPIMCNNGLTRGGNKKLDPKQCANQAKGVQNSISSDEKQATDSSTESPVEKDVSSIPSTDRRRIDPRSFKIIDPGTAPHDNVGCCGDDLLRVSIRRTDLVHGTRPCNDVLTRLTDHESALQCGKDER